jgi:hypothetical protein
MITVPPGVQAALAGYTDAQLKSAVSDALDQVAYGLWEARRRGFSITVCQLEEPAGTLNDDQAAEVIIKAAKVVTL